jgi:diguanylate cyclase (GGDEF)-like protein
VTLWGPSSLNLSPVGGVSAGSQPRRAYDAGQGVAAIEGIGFYREIVESSTVAVVTVGRDALVRHHTRAAARMLAGPHADLVGELFPTLFTHDVQGQVDALLRGVTTADAGASTFIEVTCVLGDGDVRSIEMTAVNLMESPDVEGVVLNLVDRTEMRRALTLAERQAQFDGLTGLWNRRVFDEQGRAFFREGSARPVFLAMVDIDYFKRVNDSHGHGAGDQVLRCVADRLSAAVGELGMLARLGGDEFGILLPNVSSAKARSLMEAACTAIQVPVEGLDIHLSATCGAASSTMAQHWPGLLRRTDEALYEAKVSKRGGVFFYRGDKPGWEHRRKYEREALVEAEKKVATLESDVVRLAQETRYDRRTGLLNAAAFEGDLAALHAIASQDGDPYAVVLCDIDFFREYNTRYLYQPANEVLRRVADALKGACRPVDRVYRFGGEEMTIILPRTGVRDARGLAERLRAAVADLAIPHDNRPDPKIVTVSAGVADCHPHAGETPRAVVDAANRALLVAKGSGRNRVEASA